MMFTRMWSGARALAVSLAVSALLAACGAGDEIGSSSGSPGGGDGGDDATPRADYSAHYRELGLAPRNLPAGLSVDTAVESALIPGYLAFGALVASLDLRMALQPYEWFLPKAAAGTGPRADAGTEEAPYPARAVFPCDLLGEAAVFQWEDANLDGGLSSDELLVFGFGDCKPSGGAARLYSDGAAVAQPDVQHFVRLADGFRFAIDQVGLALHAESPSLTLSAATLVRSDLDTQIHDMVFGNVVPGSGEPPATVTLQVDGAAGPVALYVPGADRGVTVPMQIRTELTEPGVLRFRVSELALRLDLANAASALEGDYAFSTAPELVLAYEQGLVLRSGGFKVTHAGRTYNYRLDADPAYLDVDIDEDGDDSPDASGRLSTALVVGRLDPGP